MIEDNEIPGESQQAPSEDARAARVEPQRNWDDDGVAVRGQEPIAVHWGANDDIIIRQQRRDDQEDALIIVRLSNVEALVEKIQAVAEDIKSSR